MRKLSNIFLTLSIVFFMMWLLFRWNYYQRFTKEEIEAAFEPITSKYGIKIVYEIGDDFFSPLKNPIVPAGPDRDSKVKPIRHRVLMSYPDILKKAFDRYPVEVIKRYLSRIHFAMEIHQANFEFGGSYDPFRRIIYLVDNSENNNDHAMYAFHHEFSSLLMARHSFWVDAWTDHHPKDFKYLCDIYDTWKAANKFRKSITDNECYEKGFVTDYGLTNFGNDFSEYSAMIFTYPEKFKKIMEKYPRVHGKFKVWLEFYHKVDPIFTEKYLFGKGGKADK